MPIREAFELKDADPQFVSIVDKGANHRAFRILKMDGANVNVDMLDQEQETLTDEQLAFYDEVQAHAIDPVPSEDEMERTVLQQLSIKRSLIDRMIAGLKSHLVIGADHKEVEPMKN